MNDKKPPLKTDDILSLFCRKTHTPEPIYLNDIKKVMERMINCGILKQEEADEYIKKNEKNETNSRNKKS